MLFLFACAPVGDDTAPNTSPDSVLEADCTDALANSPAFVPEALGRVHTVELCVDECAIGFVGGECCWPADYVLTGDGELAINGGCDSGAFVRVRW